MFVDTNVQEEAMRAGQEACLKAAADGKEVHLMEFRFNMSEKDFAFAVGWNSKVFEAGKNLLE